MTESPVVKNILKGDEADCGAWMIAALLRLKAQLSGQGSRQLRQTTSFQSKPDLAKEFPLRESCGTLAIKNEDIVLVMCLIKIYMKMSIFLENRKMVKMRVKLQYNNCFVAPLKIICFQKYFSCSIYMYNLTTKKKLGCFWSGWGYVNTLICIYNVCMLCKLYRLFRFFLLNDNAFTHNHGKSYCFSVILYI